MIYTKEQAVQIEQELAARNSKIVERAPLDYKELGTYKIFNVGPWSWPVSMGGLGTFTIPKYDPKKPFTVGKGKDKESFACSEPLEIWKLFPEGKHIDMNKMAEVFNRGEDIAKSIVGIGQFQNRQASLERYGVFIAAGDVPTEEELAEANRRFEEYDLALINEADEFYQANQHDNIGKQHREAAMRRGQDELVWVRGKGKMNKCPACKTTVDPDAAICLGCKTVLNEEKVKALKVPGYERLWQKQPSNVQPTA